MSSPNGSRESIHDKDYFRSTHPEEQSSRNKGSNIHENETSALDAPTSKNDHQFTSVMKRHPRKCSLCLFVVIPLYFLIGLCILCGHFLSNFEAKAEIKANDAALRARHEGIEGSGYRRNSTTMVGEMCIESYANSTEFYNKSEVKSHILSCRQRYKHKAIDALDLKYGGYVQYSLSFEWIQCGGNGTMPFQEDEYNITKTFENNFQRNFKQQKEEFQLDDMRKYDNALQTTTGGDHCRANSAAGAVFWFTIMTTIGYGNTPKLTKEGRLLLYTLGFVSILMFTAIVSLAGHITLLIFDDFSRHKLNAPWLIKGPFAALFWLLAYYAWLLVVCMIAKAMSVHLEWTFQNSFWMIYITTTTVGLGDRHIPHETFEYYDMLFVPALALVAMVLLGNFLRKMAECFWNKLPAQVRRIETQQALDNLRMRRRLSLRRSRGFLRLFPPLPQYEASPDVHEIYQNDVGSMNNLSTRDQSYVNHSMRSHWSRASF